MSLMVNDGGTLREMNAAELEQKAIDDAQFAKDKKDAEKAETDKVNARQIVLDRLGITADEAALLLG